MSAARRVEHLDVGCSRSFFRCCGTQSGRSRRRGCHSPSAASARRRRREKRTRVFFSASSRAQLPTRSKRRILCSRRKRTRRIARREAKEAAEREKANAHMPKIENFQKGSSGVLSTDHAAAAAKPTGCAVSRGASRARHPDGRGYARGGCEKGADGQGGRASGTRADAWRGALRPAARRAGGI